MINKICYVRPRKTSSARKYVIIFRCTVFYIRKVFGKFGTSDLREIRSRYFEVDDIIFPFYLLSNFLA